MGETCKTSAPKSNVANNAFINGLIFDPDFNLTLPNGKIQRQIICVGDCDPDAFKLIKCEGNYKTKNYKCELIDFIPNYVLDDYEVVCFENYPIDKANCYLFIHLNKTLLTWNFDSRQEIKNPISSVNTSQVICNGSFCDLVDYTIVQCLGVFEGSETNYSCSILDPKLPSKFKLVEYLVFCENLRKHENCFVIIKVDETKTELDSEQNTKKTIYTILGLIAGVLLTAAIGGILVFMFT